MLAKGDQTSALQSLYCPNPLTHYLRSLIEGQIPNEAQR